MLTGEEAAELIVDGDGAVVTGATQQRAGKGAGRADRRVPGRRTARPRHGAGGDRVLRQWSSGRCARAVRDAALTAAVVSREQRIHSSGSALVRPRQSGVVARD